MSTKRTSNLKRHTLADPEIYDIVFVVFHTSGSISCIVCSKHTAIERESSRFFYRISATKNNIMSASTQIVEVLFISITVHIAEYVHNDYVQ